MFSITKVRFKIKFNFWNLLGYKQLTIPILSKNKNNLIKPLVFCENCHFPSLYTL